MTCQHCQTWILDVEHRCRRCGRRARSTPPRISPTTYPVAATATAVAYDYMPEEAASTRVPLPRASLGLQQSPGQQPLFPQPALALKVVPFDLLTRPTEIRSSRLRVVESARPTPLRCEKVEVKRARSQKRSEGMTGAVGKEQRRLEFLGEEQVLSESQQSIICDAVVAAPGLRMRAAALDGLLMALGCAVAFAIFVYVGGQWSSDRHILPFFGAAAITIPALYKCLWAFAGQDTIGMQKIGLRLVDFDGNPPSKDRRYQRTLASIVSFLAAGMGLIWVFVDEDTLTWHDHMSNTFPTVASNK